MKRLFFSSLISIFLVSAAFSQTPDKSYSVLKNIKHKINNGWWHLLEDDFSNRQDYLAFIKEFQNKLKSVDKKINYLPYRVKDVNGDGVLLKNIVNGTEKKVGFKLNSDGSKIESYSIEASDMTAQKSLLANPLDFNFIKLAKNESEGPQYFMDYLDHYNKDQLVSYDPNQAIPFRQIDFDPLQIKFKYCEKVLFVNVCGEKEFEVQLGPVLSGKDVPGNETAFNDHFFESVVDVTAFSTPFSSTNYLPYNYVLTAVVVDNIRKEIVFLREGLVPWEYGINPGDVKFNDPVAAKYVGDFLYVLDGGDNPSIKILHISHTADGEYSVINMGQINGSNASGLSFNQVKDIGGFEGTGSETTNTILFSDAQGIKALKVNKSNGLPAGLPSSTISSLINPYDPTKSVSVTDLRRIDASRESGYVVAITNEQEIVSFSINNVFAGIPINYAFYTKLLLQYNPSNLAYMISEEKWYLTDLTGKMHTLSKEGRYSGGGGTSGKGEYGGELYKPNAITPNPITDPNNEFRYRFIVANEWAYETGFKLFAPGMMFSNFDVFESGANGNLLFTFTTSGKWEFIENATGMTFTGFTLNGTPLNSSLWNTQITASNPLTDFPNVVTMSPSDINGLRRGWNKIVVSLIVLKSGEPNEVVEREMDFYWLPSSFVPTTTASGNFKLNQYNLIGTTPLDYIYKEITVGSQGALYVMDGDVRFSEPGKVNFLSGSTFFSHNNSSYPLSNYYFKGSDQIIVNDNAYVCIETGTAALPPVQYLSLPNSIQLANGYKIGTNPSSLPEYASSDCKSPCVIFQQSNPKASFTATPNLNSGPAFDILVNSTSSTYADQVKWEVEKVVGTTLTNYQMIEVRGFSGTASLKNLLAYNFESCSSYKITLSLGCNDVGYVVSSSQTINTFPNVDAGADISTCSNVATVALSGATPAGGTWSGAGVSGSNFSTSGRPLSTPIPITYSFTDQYGCIRTDVRNITINPLPAATAFTTNTPVCEGSQLILTAPFIQDAFYKWTGPGGSLGTWTNRILTLNVSNATLESGTYKLSVVKLGCAGPLSSKAVVVKPKPVVDAGVDRAVCYNASPVALVGSPTGGSFSGIGISANSFYPANAGYGQQEITYQATGTNGCTGTDKLFITVGPDVTAGPDQSFCLNQTGATLSGNSPSGGTWSGIGTSSAGQYNPSVAGLGTHTVTYTYTDINNCTRSVTKNVTVNSVPATATLSVNSPVCINEFVTITASTIAGAEYIWTLPDNSVITGGSILSFRATPEKEGNYFLTTKVNGCSPSNPPSVSLDIIDAPITGAITGPALVCRQQTSVTYSVPVTTGSTYTWGVPDDALIVSGQGSNTITVNFGDDDGSVSVTEINSTGCKGQPVVFVVAFSAPVLGATINNPIEVGKILTCTVFSTQFNTSPANCYGNDYDQAKGNSLGQTSPDVFLRFEVEYTSDIAISLCGSTFDTYLHILDAMGNRVSSNDNYASCGTASYIRQNLNAGFYFLVVEGNGANAGQVNLAMNNYTANVGPNIAICQNDAAFTIPAFPAGGTFSGTGVTASGTFNPVGLAVGTYNINYQVTTAGCTSTAVKQIIIKPVPSSLTATSNSPVCQGSQLTLTASLIAGATYQWTTPIGNHLDGQLQAFQTSIISNEQGTYSVTANLNGCTKTVSTLVVIHERPVVDLGESIVLCEGYPINLDAGNFYQSYTWYKDGAVISGSTGSAISVTTPGTYTVEVGNSFGCKTSDAIQMKSQRDVIGRISQTSGNFTGQLTDYANLGERTEAIDDIDGDGTRDLLASAYNGSMINGVVLYDIWLMYLNQNGTVKSQQLISIPGVVWSYPSLAKYSDIDGDGRDEIVIGQPSEYDQAAGLYSGGCIYIISLNADGSVKSYNRISNSQLNPNFTHADNFAWSVENIGDIDHNGTADLAIGDHGVASGEGAVYILLMNNNLTVSSFKEISRRAGTLSFQTQFFDFFGTGIANLGDLDGDLVNDIAVTMTGSNGTTRRYGKIIILYLNSNGTVKNEVYISYDTDIDPTVISRNNTEDFGTSIENIGDTDGDGINDIIVGVPGRFEYPTISGVAWVVTFYSNGTIKSKTLLDSPLGIGQSFSKDLESNRIYFGDQSSDGGAARGAIGVMELNNQCNWCGSPVTLFRDLDGDGFGNPNETLVTCSNRTGFVTNNTDCNDANAAVNPTAIEICDGLDNNCDGIIDFIPVQNAAFCEGGAGVQLNASGGVNYSWTPVTGLSNPSIANPWASPASTTVYTVTATNAASGCTSAIKVTVTVNPNPAPPTLTANPGSSVCSGTNVTFVAHCLTTEGIDIFSRPPGSSILGGTGFPDGIAETVKMGTSSGDYVVRSVNSTTGCLSQPTTLTMTVNPNPPAPVLTPASTNVCIGGSSSFSVSTQSGYSYPYTLPPGATVTGGGGGQGGFGVGYTGITSSGSLTVYAVNSATACSTSTAAFITAIPAATVPIIAAGGPTTFCQGLNVTLTTTATGVTYQWRLNDLAIAGATASSYVANTSGNYTLTVTNPNGCFATSTAITVTVNPNPTPTVITVTPSTEVCAGTYVSVGVNYGTTDPQVYWSAPPLTNGGGGGGPGSFGFGGYAYTSGNFIAIKSNAAGCSTTVSIPFTVYPVPPTPAITSTATVLCQGGGILLNTAATAYSFQWNNNSTAISGANNSSYKATAAGSYTLTVSSRVTSNLYCYATSSAIALTTSALVAPRVTTVPDRSMPPGCSIPLKAGQAINFNGTDDYISVPAFPLTAHTSITIEFWTLVNTADVGGRVAFSIGTQDAPNRVSAHVPWSDNMLYWDYGNATNGRLSTNFSSYLNKWTHVALVADINTSTNVNTRAIYLDGVLKNSVSGTTVDNGPDANLTGLQLGKFLAGYFYKGGLDQFRIWNTALTQTQIQGYMNEEMPTGTPNMVGSWRFDEYTGNTVTDDNNVYSGTMFGSLHSRILTTAGSTYTWSPSTGLNTTTGATVTANPSAYTSYTVKAALTNGCTNIAQVNVSVISGVTCREELISTNSQGNSLETWTAELFPNPASEEVNLIINNAAYEFMKLEVFDMKGISVYKNESVNTTSIFTFGADLPSGIYIVKVWEKESQKILRLTITK